MDCDGCTIDAVEDSIWLESDLSKLRNTNILQLWRDVATKRQRAERVTSLLESLEQSVSLLNGIVQGDIPVDFKEVLFSVNVELNVMPFHF
jgi:hypothetical protein